jgi:hypothetical protein
MIRLSYCVRHLISRPKQKFHNRTSCKLYLANMGVAIAGGQKPTLVRGGRGVEFRPACKLGGMAQRSARRHVVKSPRDLEAGACAGDERVRGNSADHEEHDTGDGTEPEGRAKADHYCTIPSGWKRLR